MSEARSDSGSDSRSAEEVDAFLCDCCKKEAPEEDLIDCESCNHYMCKACMWGDQICRCHYEE